MSRNNQDISKNKQRIYRHVQWWFVMMRHLRWTWHNYCMKSMIHYDTWWHLKIPEWHIDRWTDIGRWNSPWLRGRVNFCNCSKIPPSTTQMTEIMTALDSSFREDKNQPKYHPIWSSGSWVMNYFIHTCIMEWVGPNHMSNCLDQP